MGEGHPKLPIGIQAFEKLRMDNYLYVDKTDLVWQIASSSTSYFLSRPHCFGKSLLLSTFKAYFEGKKELFTGFAIEQMEREWKKYPVLHLDLDAKSYETPEQLYDILDDNLNKWEDRFGKDICEVTLSLRFMGIIRRAYEQTGSSVEETVERMTRLYDGYHFSEFSEGVFNPFSVLNVLKSKRFDSYWFQTGTPTFLVEMLKDTEYDLRTLLNGIEAPVSMFSEYRVDANNPIPLIYQSGYLTIKDYDKEFGNYLLQFPNDEVRYGFMNFLV